VLLEVRKVARSRLSVFVHGETGTGKELVAKELHRASGRHPFVAVNVAALAPALVESELFGHARGAFTGADRDRAGLLEAARGGTLFLDEIGDLPLALQAKLLRALQERTVTRVGEVKPRPVDLRVVSASHRDLKALVDAGAFRADLYHRLVQHEVRLEPLRRRPRDLAALVAGNLGAFALVPEARKSLLAYAWPGNVRELLSALESARVLAEPGARIELAHLPASVRGVPERREPITYREILEDAKRSAIVRALEACGGNRTRAASRLGLSRQSLLYDIKKLRIEG
jgi:transcriptional regulator with PAS, ATPase and Fis domain